MNERGHESVEFLTDPDFDALRARMSPQFLYAELTNMDPELEHGDWPRCQNCGREISRAIEGELICAKCWGLAQESDEERQARLDAEWWAEWSATHCACCERPGRFPSSSCPACETIEWDDSEFPAGMEVR